MARDHVKSAESSLAEAEALNKAQRVTISEMTAAAAQHKTESDQLLEKLRVSEQRVNELEQRCSDYSSQMDSKDNLASELAAAQDVEAAMQKRIADLEASQVTLQAKLTKAEAAHATAVASKRQSDTALSDAIRGFEQERGRLAASCDVRRRACSPACCAGG